MMKQQDGGYSPTRVNPYELERVREWCHLLSDETRLGILWRLRHGDYHVSALQEYFGVSQSLLSHHLRDLREAELVSTRREGKYVYYRLTGLGLDLLGRLMELVEGG